MAPTSARKLTPEMKEEIIALIDKRVKEHYVTRSDFKALQSIVKELSINVKELSEAQKRTEQRIEELTQAQKNTEQRVEELTQAQKRTEQRVEELTQAQKNTEKRVDTLAQRMEELTQAQKNTEQRIDSLAQRMEELAQAQKNTEQRVEELTQAQKNTEQRVEELTQAQKRTEQRIEELTQAQKNTEKRVDTLAQRMEELAISLKETQIELKQLAHEHTITRKLLGDLTNTVGYGLEDTIMKYIHDYALKEYGISINTVDRRYITYPDGRYDEINIYAEGTKNGNTVYIIGESKAQLGKKDADSFDKMLARLRNHLKGEIIPFIVCYSCAPDVENYIATQYPYIRIHKSFEFYKYKKQYD